jgi:4-amino-4-deoxy-L-arabinose transferase-like glycosyltransferase
VIDARDITRPARLLVVLLLAVVVGQGVYFSQYLVPWEDEPGYLVLGAMAAKGEIRLFQNEMLGERLPLPFYVLGATQLVAGRSLVAARLGSLLLGVLAIILLWRVGTAIAGPLCGALAALFLSTQAMVVAYYATAMYHALCSLIITGGLYLLFVARAPLLGMAAFSLLSLTRPNLAVMVPVVMAVLLVQARTPRERWALVAIAVLPPVVLLASSAEHLKILAYVPFLNGLVRPLGYESLFSLGGRALAEVGLGWVGGIAWFARRYMFWIFAGMGLALGWLFLRVRSGRSVLPSAPPIRFAGLLLAYTLAWQIVILHLYPKSVAAWTVSFAPLPALVLGYYAARLAEAPAAPLWLRRAVVLGLLATFAVSPSYSTHASMPHPLPVGGTTVAALDRMSHRAAASIPEGSRVFLLGSALPTYLIGARPYLQQIIHTWTLVPEGDPVVLERSGLWGRADIEEWLGRDAQYALIDQQRLTSFRGIKGYDELAALIQAQLAANFRLVADISEVPFTPYRVYERRRTSRGSG